MCMDISATTCQSDASTYRSQSRDPLDLIGQHSCLEAVWWLQKDATSGGLISRMSIGAACLVSGEGTVSFAKTRVSA